MINTRLKNGIIISAIVIIFSIIVFLGLGTFITINHVENYTGSELHETYRQATKLLLDSDEYLLRFNLFLQDPGYFNYEELSGALEMLYLRVGVIEGTLKNFSYSDVFKADCASIYSIYDGMRQILNSGYDEIVFNAVNMKQMHLDAVNIGHEIAHDSDVLGKLHIENTKMLLIQGASRILLLVFIAILALIIIILLLVQQSRMTEQLRESESKFRAIFNESFQFFGQLDADGILIDLNNTALKLYNIKREDVINKPFCDGPWWESSPELQMQLKAAIKKAAGGETVRMDIVHKLSDGQFFHVDFSLKPVFREDGTVLMLIPEGRDVTLMKKVEEELTVLQDYLVNIIDSMPSMIIGVDSEGLVTQWNETAFRNTGIQFKDAVGKTLLSLIPGLSSCAVLIDESIRTQEVRYEKRRHSSLGNEGCYEDFIVYPLKSRSLSGAVVRIDDVTEFMKMNEMMVQSEKMLSVGGLAAGMAHEINNPLAGMMQSAAVVLERLSNDNIPANLKAAADIGIQVSDIKLFMEKREVLKLLSGIKDSGIRAASIIENMLDFSRKNDVAKSTHFIDELLERAIELSSTDYDLKRTYGFKTIKIVRQYQEGLPPIPCEGQKILQVFLNILRNGAQAMNSCLQNAESGKNSDYKPEFFLGISREDEMIRIDIKDNGPGMPDDIRKRVFEPFFTTKPVGQGTGLGLSVSFFIVNENHQGQLSVESEEGKGARFIIRLPV